MIGIYKFRKIAVKTRFGAPVSDCLRRIQQIEKHLKLICFKFDGLCSKILLNNCFFLSVECVRLSGADANSGEGAKIKIFARLMQ